MSVDAVAPELDREPGRVAPLLASAATSSGTRLVAEGALGCDVALGATQTTSGYERHRSVVSSDALGPTDAVVNTAQAVLGRPSVLPDDVTMAVLVEELIAALGLPADDGLRVELLVTVGSATQRAIPAYPGARYNPENPYPAFALTQALRQAAGYSAEGVPSLEEARRLARLGLSGLSGLLGVSLDRVRDVLTPGRELQVEDDADATDPLVGVLDDLFQRPDPDDEPPVWADRPTPAPRDDPLRAAAARTLPELQEAGIPVPAVVVALLGTLGVDLLRRLMRSALPQPTREKLRDYAKSKAWIPANTSLDGQLAEAAIRTAYLTTVAAGRAPLLGTRVGSQTLGEISAGNPLWNAVKFGLLSFLTGRVGAPDILDLDLGHVYEIKPMRGAVAGAKQLYGRYLFWLNLAELAETNGVLGPLEVAAWAAHLCTGGREPPFPPGTRTPVPPKRIWIPGPWVPPKVLWLADGRPILIEVPVPGVICYQVLGHNKQPQTVPSAAPDPGTVAKMLMALLVAWVAIEAARQAGQGGAAEVARWLQVPVPAPGEQRTELDAARDAILVVALVAAAVAVLVLAAPVAAAGLSGAAATKLFLAGGAAALVGASL